MLANQLLLLLHFALFLMHLHRTHTRLAVVRTLKLLSHFLRIGVVCLNQTVLVDIFGGMFRWVEIAIPGVENVQLRAIPILEILLFPLFFAYFPFILATK